MGKSLMNIFIRYALMGLMVLTLCACAELKQFETQRIVEGNTLYSSFPELRVHIDPSLKYIGSAEVTAKDPSTHPNNDSQDSTSSYLFGDLDPQGRLLKGILIRLTVVRGDPSKARQQDETVKQTENLLDSGLVKIMNDEYDYFLYTRTGVFTAEEQEVFPSGPDSPCYLTKYLAKNAGLGNKSQVVVIYFEDVSSGCTKGACDTCLAGDSPEATREQVLRDFDNRSYSSISFVEPKKIVDVTSRYVRPEDKKEGPSDKIPQTISKEGASEEVESRLRVLKDLLDKNLITHEDYEQKKAEILKGL